MSKSAKERLAAMRVNLLLAQPFFGTLALRLRLVEDATAPTAWTDGERLGYNPLFIARLSDAQLRGLICHEVLHCAAGHPWRRDDRSKARWGYACDYAINPIVLDAGLSLPDNVLLNDDFKGMSAEKIYTLLEDDACISRIDVASCGTLRDGRAAGATESIAEWKMAALEAAQAARIAGKYPSSLERFVTDLVEPRVNWRALLWNFVQHHNNDGYTWSSPNMRYAAAGLYLPSLRREAMGTLAVAVDTSGSISVNDLNTFSAEIGAIMDSVRPAKVVVLECDAKVHRAETYQPGDVIAVNFLGGGGTRFTPVFEHIERELQDEVECLVYLTDLAGEFPQKPPEYPVLWATVDRRATAPFGSTIFMDTTGE